MEKHKQQAFLASRHLAGLQQTFLEHRLFGNRIVAFIPAPRYYAYAVSLAQSTTLDRAIGLADRVALKCGVDRVRVSRHRGVVIYQIGLPEALWETISAASLPGPAVGVDAMRRTVDFTFDEPHALVAGVTGSGKSETLRTILYSLVRSCTPDELKLIIVDPHSELTAFDNIRHLAGPIARTPDEIARALTFAHQTFLNRRANNIRDDVRLVVVIDESNLALGNPRLMALVEQLAAESRKFKVNLIIGASRVTKAELGTLPTSLANKFVGYVTSARDSAYLAGPGLQCHRLTGQGDFLHIAPRRTERFQVALTSASDLERLERGEIQPLPLPAETTPQRPEIPEPYPAGRPRETLKPEILVDYLLTGNQISIAQAQAQFSLKRTGHTLHKRFTAKILTEFARRHLTLTHQGDDNL
jgi:S-DNA-T family DNA segregation ATPase FtsK/SpoIIIE